MIMVGLVTTGLAVMMSRRMPKCRVHFWHKQTDSQCSQFCPTSYIFSQNDLPRRWNCLGITALQIELHKRDPHKGGCVLSTETVEGRGTFDGKGQTSGELQVIVVQAFFLDVCLEVIGGWVLRYLEFSERFVEFFAILLSFWHFFSFFGKFTRVSIFLHLFSQKPLILFWLFRGKVFD